MDAGRQTCRGCEVSDTCATWYTGSRDCARSRSRCGERAAAPEQAHQPGTPHRRHRRKPRLQSPLRRMLPQTRTLLRPKSPQRAPPEAQPRRCCTASAATSAVLPPEVSSTISSIVGDMDGAEKTLSAISGVNTDLGRLRDNIDGVISKSTQTADGLRPRLSDLQVQIKRLGASASEGRARRKPPPLRPSVRGSMPRRPKFQARSRRLKSRGGGRARPSTRSPISGCRCLCAA